MNDSLEKLEDKKAAALDRLVAVVAAHEVAQSLRPFRCACGWKGFAKSAVAQLTAEWYPKFLCPRCQIRVHRE